MPYALPPRPLPSRPSDFFREHTMGSAEEQSEHEALLTNFPLGRVESKPPYRTDTTLD